MKILITCTVHNVWLDNGHVAKTIYISQGRQTAIIGTPTTLAYLIDRSGRVWIKRRNAAMWDVPITSFM